jgi:uncharacterized protein YcaQ
MPSRAPATPSTSLDGVRRLHLTRQHLAGPSGTVNRPEDLLKTIRDITCLQLDPIRVVERNHLLLLWSRVGAFDQALLDTLLWEERSLFEYWAYAASIVLTEDYPIHAMLMRRYRSKSTAGSQRRATWVRANEALRREIMSRIRKEGPLRGRDFENRADRRWESTGWTGGRDVDQMIHYLWIQGRLMVTRRQGTEKWWDLSERVLPDWTPRERLTERAVVRRAALRSLRSLGVARPKDIEGAFTVGRYPGLRDVLAGLERDRTVIRIEVHGPDGAVPGEWLVLSDEMETLAAMEGGGWAPRTTLLSPFDPVARGRAELLFGFAHKMEIYVPKANRRYGYYVMPILHGDRLIGRLDPTMDRKSGRLTINAVHAEPGAPSDAATGRAIRASVDDLARFLGAVEITFAGGSGPAGWHRALGA